MSSNTPAASRRAFIASAGMGLGSALLSTPRLSAAPGKIRSDEYWARKGSVSLYLFRKRLEASQPQAPVLLLVHGSSMSSRPTFDLTVPGHGEYSVMNTFAQDGFDVWTLDHENYGRSSRTEGNSDIASGVKDLEAAVELVVRETGQQRVHIFGESSGGLRAGAYAMARPDRIGRLVFSAFTYKGEGSSTLAQRAKQLDEYRISRSRRRRLRVRYSSSCLARDKAGTSDPAIAEFMADEELKFGDQVPTGTYLDMTANLPVVDPSRILAPVLLVRGEYDGIATVEDLADFYKRLPNGDRQFVILPDTAHSVVLGLQRQRFWHVMRAFLTMPAAVRPV